MAEKTVKTLPSGLTDVIACYGDPRPFVNSPAAWERLILFNLPVPTGLLLFAGQHVSHVRVHTLAVNSFELLFTAMLARGLQGVDYGGTYGFRMKTTRGDELSTHAWGISIDLNPARCPLACDPALQDPRIVEALDEAGFFWGGLFHGTRDPMHGQLCVDY